MGYGDADPSNVSPLVHGAEMREAETRAVNRALRKAYGIGICSVEEIVISHQKRAVNVLSKPGLRLTSGRDADSFAADTVVEYGSDVTMWSRKHGAILNRLGH